MKPINNENKYKTKQIKIGQNTIHQYKKNNTKKNKIKQKNKTK